MIHKAAQLRSLSFEEDSVAARVDDDAETGLRRAVWPRAVAVMIGIGAAAYGASLTPPGRAALDLVRPKSDPAEASHAGVGSATQARTGQEALATVAAPLAAPALPVAAAAQQLLGSGYSRAGRDVVLGAPLPARITSVEVVEGDRVAAGAVLVRLNDRSAREAATRAELALREAQLAQAKAALALTQSSQLRARAEALSDRKAGTRLAADDAALALDLARMEAQIAAVSVTSAETALAGSRAHLADYVVRAPFNGVVAALSAVPGMITSGDQSDALLRLFDPTSLVVDIDIAERSLGDLTAGLGARIVFDAWPDQSFDGHVTEIAPMLSKERGTVRVTVTLDTIPPALRPNMAARATLLLDDHYRDATEQLSGTSNANNKGDDDV